MARTLTLDGLRERFARGLFTLAQLQRALAQERADAEWMSLPTLGTDAETRAREAAALAAIEQDRPIHLANIQIIEGFLAEQSIARSADTLPRCARCGSTDGIMGASLGPACPTHYDEMSS